MRIIYIVFVLSSMVFSASSSFSIKEKDDLESIIEFNIGEFSIEDKDGYHTISSTSKGNTQNIGQPELPTYTFNYAIDYNSNYHVTIEENDYIIYNDVNLYPSQPFYNVNQEELFIILAFSYPAIYNSFRVYGSCTNFIAVITFSLLIFKISIVE